MLEFISFTFLEAHAFDLSKDLHTFESAAAAATAASQRKMPIIDV